MSTDDIDAISEGELKAAAEAQVVAKTFWIILRELKEDVASTVITLIAANFLANKIGIRETELHKEWFATLEKSVTHALANYPGPDRKN